MTTYLTIRAKAFSCEPVGNYRARVDDDDSVWVYDSVAGHYTTCHILSVRTQRRIRKQTLTAA